MAGHLGFILIAYVFGLGPWSIATCERCDSCPDGWVSFQRSCYLFADISAVHFTEAEHYCRQHGGHLVTVEGSLENGFLKNYLKHIKAPNHWLGITDELVEGVWTWKVGGSRINYTDWRPQQPDNWHGNEDCAIFEASDYRWDDEPCTNNNMPLCEKMKATEPEMVG